MPVYSMTEMREQVLKLNRISADRADFGTIQKIYGRMFDGMPTVVGTTSGGELFFRARVNPPSRLTQVRELTSPPPEMVTGYQRCNGPGNPRFYCSSRRITALRECRVLDGDIVYLSQWIGKEELPVNKMLHPEHSAGLVDKMTPAQSMLYSHLDTTFTRRVHHTFSNDYKFSAAIAEELTHRYPAGKYKIEGDGAVGLRYPSVVDLENSYNTSFPAHFALERIDILHLMELRIDSVTENDISVTLMNSAIDFHDGEIRWADNPLCVPVPRDKKRSVPFRFNGAKWQVDTLESFMDLVPKGNTRGFVSGYIEELLKE